MAMYENNFNFPNIQEMYRDTERIMRQLDILRVNLEMTGYLDEKQWNMIMNLITELGEIRLELLKGIKGTS